MILKSQAERKLINRTFSKLHLQKKDQSGDQYDGFWAEFLNYLTKIDQVSLPILKTKFPAISQVRFTHMLDRLISIGVVRATAHGEYDVQVTKSDITELANHGWKTITPDPFTVHPVPEVPLKMEVSKEAPSESFQTMPVDEYQAPGNDWIAEASVDTPDNLLSKLDYLNQTFAIVPHFESDLIGDLIYDEVDEYPLVYDIQLKRPDRTFKTVIENVSRHTVRQIFDLYYQQYCDFQR